MTNTPTAKTDMQRQGKKYGNLYEKKDTIHDKHIRIINQSVIEVQSKFHLPKMDFLKNSFGNLSAGC